MSHAVAKRCTQIFFPLEGVNHKPRTNGRGGQVGARRNPNDWSRRRPGSSSGKSSGKGSTRVGERRKWSEESDQEAKVERLALADRKKMAKLGIGGSTHGSRGWRRFVLPTPLKTSIVEVMDPNCHCADIRGREWFLSPEK
ncbi:hypothetical protein ASPWEDRAFT_29883 [Aspergillus wentii DTO 134E9]|uniref:Uncharacterized protein n=1 Tax=Aspergillus wentii DTO 134E9 TaxID=1073089 RepID=A0A1L9RCY1_ASPWE|nr:uncharacterized protein ASPWEDRAFT_29883 [Aspergillus wentii DTO 134E9]OJJ32737.1 hypothetical protein ASPWEDRAFT_29883 [Aspergillus wentii DTO 134E9]